MDPKLERLKRSLLISSERLLNLSTNETVENKEAGNQCINVNETLLLEFWTTVEQSDVISSLYTFASTLSHCGNSLLTLNVDYSNSGKHATEDCVQLLMHINEIAETLLANELKVVCKFEKKTDAFVLPLMKKAKLICVFDLFHLYGASNERVLEIYGEFRCEMLKQLFNKWIAETTAKSAGQQNACPSHVILEQVMEEEFAFAVNSPQEFSPYEFLHSVFLNPLTQSVSEFVKKQNTKDVTGRVVQPKFKSAFVDLVYGLHMLENRLDKLFDKISIGNDKLFNTPEIAAVFKNNSTDLMAMLFSEMQYSTKRNNFNKQIWHWRIPFLISMPKIYTILQQLGETIYSDIIKIAKVHSTELSYLDGMKWNCFHGMSNFVTLTKSVTFFVGWERHSVEAYKKILEIFTNIQRTIKQEIVKFPNSINMTTFQTLLSSVSYCCQILQKRHFELGSTDNKFCINLLEDFVAIRKLALENFIDFFKNQTKCFTVCVNPLDDFSILKQPQRPEIQANLQMWRMQLNFVFTKVSSVNLNDKKHLVDLLEQNVSVLFQNYFQCKPSETRRQVYSNHIWYMLHVIESVLYQIVKFPSDILTNVKTNPDSDSLLRVHILCRKMIAMQITQKCKLEQLHKLCKICLSKQAKCNLSWLHFLNPYHYPENHLESFSGQKLSLVIRILCRLLNESTDNGYLVLWIICCKNFAVSALFLRRLTGSTLHDDPNFDGHVIVATSFLWLFAFSDLFPHALIAVFKPLFQLDVSGSGRMAVSKKSKILDQTV